MKIVIPYKPRKLQKEIHNKLYHMIEQNKVVEEIRQEQYKEMNNA